MDHIAFENCDQNDPGMAFAIYKQFRSACRAHVLMTLGRGSSGFDWNLRTYEPFRRAFPTDAKLFDDKWDLGVVPARHLEDPEPLESILTHEERLLLKSGKGLSDVAPVLDKIAANPKHDDVITMLVYGAYRPEEYLDAYTPEVHEQLVKLIEPLKVLIHDVEYENKATTLPPVRAIGMEVHQLGGFLAQQAVFYAITMLLHSEKAYCADGAPWSSTGSSLTTGWDGCGQWMA